MEFTDEKKKLKTKLRSSEREPRLQNRKQAQKKIPKRNEKKNAENCKNSFNLFEIALTSHMSFMLVASVDVALVSSTTSPDNRLARASLKSRPCWNSFCQKKEGERKKLNKIASKQQRWQKFCYCILAFPLAGVYLRNIRCEWCAPGHSVDGNYSLL